MAVQRGFLRAMGNWDFVWDLRIFVARSCSFSWPSLATPTGHELALTEDRAGPGSLRGASPGRARHGDAPRGFCNARLPDGSREQWWATLGRSCFGLDPRHSRAVIVSVKPRVTKSSTPATVTIPLTRGERGDVDARGQLLALQSDLWSLIREEAIDAEREVQHA